MQVAELSPWTHGAPFAQGLGVQPHPSPSPPQVPHESITKPLPGTPSQPRQKLHVTSHLSGMKGQVGQNESSQVKVPSASKVPHEANGSSSQTGGTQPSGMQFRPNAARSISRSAVSTRPFWLRSLTWSASSRPNVARR